MKHPVDVYKDAVKFANEQTFEKFSVHGPYQPNTEAHAYWLKEMDYKFKSTIVKENLKWYKSVERLRRLISQLSRSMWYRRLMG